MASWLLNHSERHYVAEEFVSQIYYSFFLLIRCFRPSGVCWGRPVEGTFTVAFNRGTCRGLCSALCRGGGPGGAANRARVRAACPGASWGLAEGIRRQLGTSGFREFDSSQTLLELVIFSLPLSTRCRRKSFMEIFSYLHIGYRVLWCRARSELLLSVCSDQSRTVW